MSNVSEAGTSRLRCVCLTARPTDSASTAAQQSSLTAVESWPNTTSLRPPWHRKGKTMGEPTTYKNWDARTNPVWVACPTCSERVEMPVEPPLPRTAAERNRFVDVIVAPFARRLAAQCQYNRTFRHFATPAPEGEK